MVAAAPSFRGADASKPSRGWLRSAPFDLGFIVGVGAIAATLTAVASRSPELFLGALLVDLWLFAYPHVASTFTRIAFDRKSVREHAGLLFALPPVVFAATTGVYALGGAIAINTLYFHWQSYHYTKQSYGIARAYERAAGAAASDRLSDVVVFAFPIWGALHRIVQRPPRFYAAALWSPPMPPIAEKLAAIVAIAALALWTLRALRRAHRGTLAAGHTLFVASHIAVTIWAYLIATDVTVGWLTVNVWHNAQYLLFVYAFQSRRFAGGVEADHRAVSWLAQPGRGVLFGGVCVALGTAFYFTLGKITTPFAASVIPLVLVSHQAVNFHHYLVDAVIWRRRRTA